MVKCIDKNTTAMMPATAYRLRRRIRPSVLQKNFHNHTTPR